MTEGWHNTPSSCDIKLFFCCLNYYYSRDERPVWTKLCKSTQNWVIILVNCLPGKSSFSIFNHLLQKASIQMLNMVFAKLANDLYALLHTVRICNLFVICIYKISLHFMIHLNWNGRSRALSLHSFHYFQLTRNSFQSLSNALFHGAMCSEASLLCHWNH